MCRYFMTNGVCRLLVPHNNVKIVQLSTLAPVISGKLLKKNTVINPVCLVSHGSFGVWLGDTSFEKGPPLLLEHWWGYTAFLKFQTCTCSYTIHVHNFECTLGIS